MEAEVPFPSLCLLYQNLGQHHTCSSMVLRIRAAWTWHSPIVAILCRGWMSLGICFGLGSDVLSRPLLLTDPSALSLLCCLTLGIAHSQKGCFLFYKSMASDTGTCRHYFFIALVGVCGGWGRVSFSLKERNTEDPSLAKNPSCALCCQEFTLWLALWINVHIEFEVCFLACNS